MIVAEVTEFDPSALLDHEKVITEYLTAALEDGNPDVFLAAVGHVKEASPCVQSMKLFGSSRDNRSKFLSHALDRAPLNRVSWDLFYLDRDVFCRYGM